MPYKEGQDILIDYLSLLPVKQVAKERRFWGGSYIRLYDYLWVLSFLYESGAILGRARYNKISILEKMLVIPDATEDKSMKIWQEEAKERLYRYRRRCGKEPDTFSEFIFERELEIATGLNPLDSLEAYNRGNKKAWKAYDRKVPLEKAGEGGGVWNIVEKTLAEIRIFVLEGIGFGSLFPELTEKMNKKYYESIHIDMDAWSEFMKTGYGIPEKPTLSLEEQEEIVLWCVAEYTAACYPELLDPLDLTCHYHIPFRDDVDGKRYYDYLTRYHEWLYLAELIRDAMYIGGGYLLQ